MWDSEKEAQRTISVEARQTDRQLKALIQTQMVRQWWSWSGTYRFVERFSSKMELVFCQAVSSLSVILELQTQRQGKGNLCNQYLVSLLML